MVFNSFPSLMHAGTMRELIGRHMVEGMLIHSYARARAHAHIDVNRNSDKSALVASHVIPHQEPDAGLTFDLVTLTLGGTLVCPFLVLIKCLAVICFQQ